MASLPTTSLWYWGIPCAFLNVAVHDVMQICRRQMLCSVKTHKGTGVNFPTKPVTYTICKNNYSHFKMLHD